MVGWRDREPVTWSNEQSGDIVVKSALIHRQSGWRGAPRSGYREFGESLGVGTSLGLARCCWTAGG